MSTRGILPCAVLVAVAFAINGGCGGTSPTGSGFGSGPGKGDSGPGGGGGDDDSGTGFGDDGGPGFGDDGSTLPPGDASCASTSSKAQGVPVELVFMFDRSGSMNQQSKWTSCSQGLNAFFADPNSAGLSASLQFFEQLDQCNVAAYATPLVAMTALPDATSFSAAIAATSPFGETPTLPALQGALQYAQQEQQSKAGIKAAVVLVTDGEPNVCNSTLQAVAAAAQAAAATTPTYVIGIGNVANLNAIAQAGGTNQAFIVSTGNPQQTATDLENALATIKGSQLSCEYKIPAPPAGQTLNYNQVNVVYTPSSGQSQTLTYNGSCSGNGQGWHYDNAQTPTKIEICPGSCTTIQADKSASIAIELGCATKGGVQ
jgi:uncharacterized protein YegL